MNKKDFVCSAADALVETFKMSLKAGAQSEDYNAGFMSMIQDWANFIERGEEVDMKKYNLEGSVF